MAAPPLSSKGDIVGAYLIHKGKLLVHKTSNTWKSSPNQILTPSIKANTMGKSYSDLAKDAIFADSGINARAINFTEFSRNLDPFTGTEIVLMKAFLDKKPSTIGTKNTKIDTTYDFKSIPGYESAGTGSGSGWVNLNDLESWLNSNPSFKNDDLVNALKILTSKPEKTGRPAAATPPDPIITLEKAIISLNKLKGSVKSTTEGELVTEIKNFFTSKEILNCDSLSTISSEIEDYWNVYMGYLKLIGQEETAKSWKDVDEEYKKLLIFYYELQEHTKIVKGGLRPGRTATKLFNESLKKINTTNISKNDEKIRKVLDELDRGKKYIDKLYTDGTPPSSDVIGKLKTDIERIDKIKTALITERDTYLNEEEPESRFSNLLTKFKSEAQLISWLEKAKTENIEATAEYKKANQKFKSLSLIKETIDKCVETMKKSVNKKCELINDYDVLLRDAKNAESKQQSILELNALRLDPARGSNTIQLFLEKYQLKPLEFITKIQSETVVLETLLQTLRDTIRDSPLAGGAEPGTPSGISGILNMARDSIQQGVLSSEQNLRGVVDKSGIIRTFSYNEFIKLKNEFSMFMEIEDRFIKELKAIFEANKANYTMKLAYFIELLTLPTSGIIALWKKFVDKYTVVATVIKSESWAPITSEILRRKQESEALLSNIEDKVEELQESKTAPSDIPKCFDIYKTTLEKQNQDIQTEVTKIETEANNAIKKVPEDIAKIRESLRVNINEQNNQNQNNQNQNQSYKNWTPQQLNDEEKKLVDRIARFKTIKNLSEKDKKRLGNAEKELVNVKNVIAQKKSNPAPAPAPAPGGGSRAYAHSTRRYIRR